ncbi:protein kinase-like domain-containing protein [Artemisia annua]|uniref:Protein kinase-like domain-containing protein n=1 Tax=Artemisia annua TaxID=35608 RepID=A0A2U1PJB9_ARTAN|nr:protein kinase-like domain-containing protein [Artemisia annua]
MTLYRMVKKIKGKRNDVIPGSPLTLFTENFSSEASKIAYSAKILKFSYVNFLVSHVGTMLRARKNTEVFICKFPGVTCWNNAESKVLYIDISNMGLRGPFPMGLGNCTSLTRLDLSNNSLTGTIPSNLADVLPYLVTLDLSYNNLSGPIPPAIGNCSSINILKLNNNLLTGQITPNLGNDTFTADCYANNLGFCGGPLRPCKKERHEDPFFSGFEIGFPASTVLTMLLMFYCLPTLSMSNMTPYRMIKKIKRRSLKSIKETLEDPYNVLSSWVFSKNTEVFICKFPGVTCWSNAESKVLYIDISNMGLRGPFPMGLGNCTSLTRLDLSNNSLTGTIPSNLADVLPYLVTLDLSYNNLSGPIPPGIGNCSSINILKLNNNLLTGQITPNLGNDTFTADCYANNLGLCGGPLRPCKKERHEDPFFSGFEIGFPASTVLTMLLMFYCLPTLSMSNMTLYRMIKKIKRRRYHLVPETSQLLFEENFSSKESKISAMEKFICRMSLAKLEMATNNFDNKKVIGYGYMGLMYKAMFPNGLLLAVKRLHKFESFEKEFLLEIEILGRLRHTNLVPLLSFCYESEKKFLVYKYMCNGTLHQWLHFKPHVEGKKMGWTLRFKIAIGIARGLAWLHHNNVLRVAHLNISSRCILLDEKFEPKISNFGNSDILMNTSGIPSSICNFVVPDSDPSPYKEDVYSFGILLLELITDKEPSTWINFPIHYVCGGEFTVIPIRFAHSCTYETQAHYPHSYVT